MNFFKFCFTFKINHSREQGWGFPMDLQLPICSSTSSDHFLSFGPPLSTPVSELSVSVSQCSALLLVLFYFIFFIFIFYVFGWIGFSGSTTELDLVSSFSEIVPDTVIFDDFERYLNIFSFSFACFCKSGIWNFHDHAINYESEFLLNW